MEKINYLIIIARFNFTCPISGCKVKRGDICLEDTEGKLFSMSMLPARRLKKIETT